MRLSVRLLRHAAVLLPALALTAAPARGQAPRDSLRVTVVTDQAEAVLAIAEKAARDERVTE